MRGQLQTRAACLVVGYTGLIALADGITKALATGYDAAQMFAVSGAVVVTLCLISAALGTGRKALVTRCRRAMALRSLATVLAAICFFLAFRELGFADVFLFIGLMPLIAALMAGPILDERVAPVAWGAIGAGIVGVLLLFPAGASSIQSGHVAALLAAVFGTLSIVLARYVGRYETTGLAQVLYPNLAILLVAGVALPFVWQPMPLADLALAVSYGGILFVARLILVVALRDLAAHAVTSLMKLQFIWMVLIGAVAFGEWPTLQTWLGAGIVIASGLALAYEDQLRGLPLTSHRKGRATAARA